ncbi:MAG: SAM-dependent chlorinase/fluorinase [Terrisporobacter sp.]|uniref:SAM hydrolase/SAM-dependent halogenase family protein n=1 Tax=Terrisporobacter sp. TaxID=1965305 RepID=UPI002FCB00DB
MSNLKAAIVMQTDFTKDISVCTMHGVCMMIDPELRIFDSTHDIQCFNTYQASTSLSFVVDFWPKGTVFVSVVDPGVGTSRRACVAKLKNGSYVVTPDNGSLTHLKKYFGVVEVRVIDEEKNRLQSTKECNIFHGRDLFSYCAAKLASGIITFEEVGVEYQVEEIIEHEIIPFRKEGNNISGMIDSADFHFGLICSNVPAKAFEEDIQYGDKLKVKITNVKEDKIAYEGIVPFCPSFGSVKKGEPLLMISETIQIQIAMNEVNMAELYNIGCGSEWKIVFKKCEN